MRNFPKIDSIWKAKKAERLRLAALPFSEKLKIVGQLQELHKQMKRANIITQGKKRAARRSPSVSAK
jgi:hypothetical protein